MITMMSCQSFLNELPASLHVIGGSPAELCSHVLFIISSAVLWRAGHQPLCQILIDRGPFLPYLSSVMIKILEQIKIWADA